MHIIFVNLLLVTAGSDIFHDNMKWELTHSGIYLQAKCKIRIYSRELMGFCFQKCLFAGRLTIAYPLAVCVTAWYHPCVCLHAHTAYMLLSREVASLPSVSVIIMPRVCFSDNNVIEHAPPFNYLETQTLSITVLTESF